MRDLDRLLITAAALHETTRKKRELVDRYVATSHVIEADAVLTCSRRVAALSRSPLPGSRPGHFSLRRGWDARPCPA
jgi:hypothetical protein